MVEEVLVVEVINQSNREFRQSRSQVTTWKSKTTHWEGVSEDSGILQMRVEHYKRELRDSNYVLAVVVHTQ